MGKRCCLIPKSLTYGSLPFSLSLLSLYHLSALSFGIRMRELVERERISMPLRGGENSLHFPYSLVSLTIKSRTKRISHDCHGEIINHFHCRYNRSSSNLLLCPLGSIHWSILCSSRNVLYNNSNITHHFIPSEIQSVQPNMVTYWLRWSWVGTQSVSVIIIYVQHSTITLHASSHSVRQWTPHDNIVVRSSNIALRPTPRDASTWCTCTCKATI